jgi:putative transposase
VENLRVFAEEAVVRITTPDGFLWLPVVVPEYFREAFYRPHVVFEIARKGDDWFLMLAVKSEDVPALQGERPHFGLDLGLANLAVLSGPGVVKFFDGKPLRYIRGKFFRYRRALQRKRKIGMVKRSKGSEARWIADCNHKISREVVNTVAAAGGVLHVERLSGIRERCRGTAKINRMIAGWPFAQLLGFLRYKAALAGVIVVEEDPRYTSQCCSRCGHAERANRPKQAAFACKQCGFRLHADLNAARNLAAGGACSFGVAGVTPAPSAEVRIRPHGKRNLASSASEAIA